ncbi:MAG: ATP-binding protein [Chloroflexi bacterium]|nr:ATP-binding protein [Chloroflexota bacterium]
MESLGDILKRLTPGSGSGGTAYPGPDDSEEEAQNTPACPICGDFGWVRVEVPVGHPYFGKVIPCRCQQRDEDPSRLARLQRYSNMGPLTRLSFQATRPEGRSADAEGRELFHQAYERALAFAENPRGWLVFTGPSGCGKTHLAAAIANRVVERGQPVFFVFVPDLLDHLRSTFTPSSEVSYDQFFEQVRNTPFLVLDDLGGHSSTPWAQEKLYQILNHRYTAQMPTVITMSLPLEELDPHWQTRLGDTELVTICSLGTKSAEGPLGQWGMVEPELRRRMTFESFDVRGNKASRPQRQSLEAALQMAINFARDPDGWLVLYGSRGCGKTHLSVAIANESLKLGKDVRYFLVADLLDRLRDAFSPDSTVSYYRLFEQVRNADLLVLEDFDFDMRHVTPWAREKLYQILVHRHDARLPTVITALEMIDEEKSKDPIISRLQDVAVVNVVPIDAPDYRYQGRGRRDLP